LNSADICTPVSKNIIDRDRLAKSKFKLSARARFVRRIWSHRNSMEARNILWLASA